MAEYLYVGACGESGVLVYQWLPDGEELRYVGKDTACRNPTYFAMNPRAPVLYAADESADGAWIVSYEIDPGNGMLRYLHTKGIPGNRLCHLQVLPDASAIAASNYDSGNMVFCALGAQGELEEDPESIQHEGSGPRPQQECAHLHQTIITPEGKHMVVVDLGSDCFAVYRLRHGEPPSCREMRKVCIDAGEGPRHMRFHPNGLFAYLATELGNRLYAYRYCAASGSFDLEKTYDLLPDGVKDASYSADLCFSKDQRFLYVSVRGYDHIVRFCVDGEDGRLFEPAYYPCYGKFPRMIALDSGGGYMFVANQKSDAVAVMPIDKRTGGLMPPCNLLRCGQPHAVFAAVSGNHGS